MVEKMPKSRKPMHKQSIKDDNIRVLADLEPISKYEI
jgi:hypothetical protein